MFIISHEYFMPHFMENKIRFYLCKQSMHFFWEIDFNFPVELFKVNVKFDASAYNRIVSN